MISKDNNNKNFSVRSVIEFILLLILKLMSKYVDIKLTIM